MALGALIAGGVSAAVGLFGGGGDINIPPPPDPANFYSFEVDSQGNLVEGGSYTWNKGSGSYTWKPRSLNSKEVEEVRLRGEMKTRLLSELNVTPEQRLKQYDDYAKTYSDFIHKDVDVRFAERQQSQSETAQRRGLFGSEFQRVKDTRLEEEQKKSDVDIAQRSFLAKEDLAERDRRGNIQGLQVLQDLESGDFSRRAATQQLGVGAAGQANQFLLDSYRSSIGAATTKASLEAKKKQDIFDTVSGLAFLTGMNVPSKSPSASQSTVSGSIFKPTEKTEDPLQNLFAGGF